MPAKPAVHLVRVADNDPQSWPEAVRRLFAAAPPSFIRARDRVAVKVHVGEEGLATRLPTSVAAAAAAAVRERGGRPFFTDTAVLYSGLRSDALGHTELAIRHGYTPERAGAPFLPADGLVGNLEVAVGIPGRHFQSVNIAEAIAHANGAVLVSHATGHLVTGMGATLKNLGMGCSSRKGKLLQHSDTKPFVAEEKCIACGECVVACPARALATDAGGKAALDEALCTGCGECIATCRSDAIRFRWDASPAVLQEKMVEHALGAATALRGRFTCLLGLVNLTKHCDCWAEGSPRVADDVGFLLSPDPVAIDQAALDLVAAAEGTPLDKIAWPKLDATVQLAHGERLGLGRRDYELVEI